ncbi:hypothetical protein PVA44_03010 [Entomospira nematocerorum]|uniref:Uncharacterized protein n=1 Tax=Entomospira nematocerorum TaxID=2719987 RepID=A0A968KT24_9SPIO|nr:hypothetical protein [Entomospira nematocera]NIZ46996.1 hypothetical protein [Entomospira nematocera]WDI34460.1 hypothetical protein PVA44_03010 [Entomospira nematocera]
MKNRLIGIVLFWLVCSASITAAQILMIKQSDNSSVYAQRIELALSDWFFEHGILALSEQNPIHNVSFELAQYMAKEMNAKALVLWSIDLEGKFILEMFHVQGQLLADIDMKVKLQDSQLESIILNSISPTLKKAIHQLKEQ